MVRIFILLVPIILIVFSILKAQVEKINFESANPFSFYHVITDLHNQDKQDCYGILRFPDQIYQKPVPLVIGINGSKNWADHHYEYMQVFREMGIATFELHSFNSRQVQSTVGEQVSVTTAMMILDAYRALDILANDKRIDEQNIAIIGWSLGGGVALFSAWMPLIDAIGIEKRFKAHLAFYPPCLVKMNKIEFSESPIHILIGENDDWVSSDACYDLIQDISSQGYDAGITIFENAHHGFDRVGSLQREYNGYSLGNCSFKMREDGALLTSILNIPITSPIRQKLALAWCADRGTTIGGNPEARKASFSYSKEFMRLHLLK